MTEITRDSQEEKYESLFASFAKLKKELGSHERWQKDKYSLYSGDHRAKTLNISLSEKMDASIPAKNDWARISVDFVYDQFDFDVLKNDQWGLNDLLIEADCDNAFNSAIKSSLIGACGFVSVTRGNTVIGEPEFVLTAYNGLEATGVYNSRTGRLEAGLTKEFYYDALNNKVDYFKLFLPDGIYDVLNQGAEIRKVEDGTGVVALIPFVFKKDAATNPFGESRITKPAVDAIDRALRTIKRMELSSESYANPQRYIAVQTAVAEGDKKISEEEASKMSKIGRYLVYEGVAEDVKFGEFSAQGPQNLRSMLESDATQFAAAMFMEPSDFGVEASNGGLSSETITKRKEKMQDLVRKAQKDYGRSIIEVARVIMLLRYGSVDAQFNKVTARFLNRKPVDRYGAIGDAIGKIQEVAPSTRNTDFVLDTLGISMRGLLDESGTVNTSEAVERLSQTASELRAERNSRENQEGRRDTGSRLSTPGDSNSYSPRR